MITSPTPSPSQITGNLFQIWREFPEEQCPRLGQRFSLVLMIISRDANGRPLAEVSSQYRVDGVVDGLGTLDTRGHRNMRYIRFTCVRPADVPPALELA